VSFPPASFDNVEVLKVGVSGPGGANTLFIVCGVALINFNGTGDDWHRDNVTFLVPGEGGGNPAPLDVGGFEDSVVVAFPATIESRNGETIGWGVDTVDTVLSGSGHVELNARVVVRNSDATFLRMGFQVSILSRT
jgi:hypothetical protein